MTRYTSPLTALVLALSVTTASAQSLHLPEPAPPHGLEFTAVPATLAPPALPPTLTRQALDLAAAMPAAQAPKPSTSAPSAPHTQSDGIRFLAGLIGAGVGMLAGGFAGTHIDAGLNCSASAECLPLYGLFVGSTVGAGVGAALGVRFIRW